MAKTQHVRLSIARGIAHIELSNPRTGNRIDTGLATELRTAAEAVTTNDAVRVLLITGRGRDFCAGGMEIQAAGGRFEALRVGETIARIPQPVVVAVHGRVFDQGLELALAGDLRVASSDARFAMRQVVGGGLPFDGGTQRLPRIAGRGLATDMLLTGRELSAGEAYAAGLVTGLFEPEGLAGAARDLASQIEERGSVAGRFAKEAISRGVEMPLEDGLRLEADLSLLLIGDRERTEGLDAFREKRPPRFVR